MKKLCSVVLSGRTPVVCVFVLVLGLTSVHGWAQQSDQQKQQNTQQKQQNDQQKMRGLDEQVQETKSDILNISQELSRLEEKLLYPSGTQVAIFIAVAKGDQMRL